LADDIAATIATRCGTALLLFNLAKDGSRLILVRRKRK
jgi:hypothetical protein